MSNVKHRGISILISQGRVIQHVVIKRFSMRYNCRDRSNIIVLNVERREFEIHECKKKTSAREGVIFLFFHGKILLAGAGAQILVRFLIWYDAPREN